MTVNLAGMIFQIVGTLFLVLCIQLPMKGKANGGTVVSTGTTLMYIIIRKLRIKVVALIMISGGLIMQNWSEIVKHWLFPFCAR